ncbi:hypothetical protein NBRC111894_3088 [Sporolactobacillus inulinus]|uniref:PepSY domain-containing protein n=1 Tax=Sporolactobacillus inulinus TaxID=2078 RepID=A0A4Y1ZF00_9BACL|nr:PepSY domain-containing protein [Sporolactobacillus inulinus]GAY77534.1 hypothetical protein NBRC111894_3088 [Sporolactobacillus inulinus]
MKKDFGFGTAFLIGSLIGYLAGRVTTCNATGKKSLSSEHVLEQVKREVKEQIPIEGAWIFLTPHTWSKDNLTHLVYKGGLIASRKNDTHHFDFIADAKSGAVLELNAQD